MNFQPNKYYYLYGQTFRNTLAFPTRENYKFFLRKIASLSTACDIVCYCLAPDQFHLIIYIPEGSPGLVRTADDQMQSICRIFGKILSSYTKAYNRQERRRGSLFQPRTRCRCLAADFKSKFEEIHQLPVNVGLVFDASQWEFSSYREHRGLIAGFCSAWRV